MTDIDENTLSLIKENSEMVVQKLDELVDFKFGYDEDSMEWFDGYVKRLYESGFFEGKFERMLSVLGSYAGEAIIARYGGKWAYFDEGLGIQIAERFIAFPFTKLEKQMQGGEGDSIISFYRSIEAIISLKNKENDL